MVHGVFSMKLFSMHPKDCKHHGGGSVQCSTEPVFWPARQARVQYSTGLSQHEQGQYRGSQVEYCYVLPL